jgi:uncharacterized protein
LTCAATLREHANVLPEQAQPLNPADLARLDHFLHTAACGQEAMGLSYAHGFLTAVASGPERLEPSEWLRLMFDEPVFESGAEAGEMLGLALRLFREIEHGLHADAGFRPVLESVRDTAGDTHVDAQHWCRGFVSGFGLFSERWSRTDRAALHTPLRLIFQLAGMRGLPDPVYARLCEVVPDAAALVYRYWQTEGRR